MSYFKTGMVNINGFKRLFKHDISEFKEMNDLIFVRLAVPLNTILGTEDFSNVYCIDNNGSINVLK